MKKYQVAIVGSGFAGLCMGIHLKQAGVDDFIILEKAPSLGGTWRDNTYPGAECDIPSALYSYSFEHNHDWEYKWSGQAQILKYQQDTAKKYDLTEHFVFDQNIVAADFDIDSSCWVLSTDSRQQFCASHFVPAVGQLHIPSTPAFPGLEEYAGEQFHSAQWRHDVDLADKRVAVIGNAASAVQLIPEIVDKVASLEIFQRSPNWILPKVDRPYTAWEQRLSRRIPLLAVINRFSIWLLGEWVVLPSLRGNRFTKWLVRTACRWNLHKHIEDPELREVLTPAYSLGAKRILFSDNYYPALMHPAIHLQTKPIECFDEKGIKVEGESSSPFDVVIFATGFHTNPFLKSIAVRGTHGQLLRDCWNEGAHAYLGIHTHGFPNMHMLYGPNTNLGHTSIILMIEVQTKYIVQCLQGMATKSLSSIEVREEVESSYNHTLQQRLSKLAFNEIDASWYKDGNRITNNWAGGTAEYSRRLREFEWDNFNQVSS